MAKSHTDPWGLYSLEIRSVKKINKLSFQEHDILGDACIDKNNDFNTPLKGSYIVNKEQCLLESSVYFVQNFQHHGTEKCPSNSFLMGDDEAIDSLL